MLMQQLLALKPAHIEESKELNMSAEVRITSGNHKGKEGYINKIVYGDNRKVVSYEVQIDDFDTDETEYVVVKPNQVKAVDDLNEAYQESANWDADMEKLQEHLKAALAIMDSANWAKHIDDTESNFDVDGLRSTHDSLYNAVDEANTLAKDFYNAMEEAA